MSRRCHLILPVLLVLLGRSERAAAQLTSGDRLVVGSMSGARFTDVKNLPLPQFVNQKFCGIVQLSSDVAREAYVPTLAERQGNFSAFNGLLIDSATKQPFQGGIIPPIRLPGNTSDPYSTQGFGVFAWRVAVPAGGAGPDCLPYPGGIPFASVDPESGFVPGVRQLRATPATLTFDYTPNQPFANTQTISLYSTGASVPFGASYSIDAPAGGKWLQSVLPLSGATPAGLTVKVDPTGLQSNTYSGVVSVRQDIDLPAVNVRVNLIVRAAAPTLILPRDVRLTIDLSKPGSGLSAEVEVKSTTGAPLRFSVKPLVKTPIGFEWLSSNVTVGVTPAVVTLRVNPNGLGVGAYLAMVRFSVTSTCDASGPRLASVLAAECEGGKNVPVVVDIVNGLASGNIRSLTAPERLSVAEGSMSGSFVVAGGLALVGTSPAFRLTAVAAPSEPPCTNWLSVTPADPFGVGVMLTAMVDRASVDGIRPFRAYIGVSGTEGAITAGAVVEVVLAGVPSAAEAIPVTSNAGPETRPLTLEQASSITNSGTNSGSPPHADAPPVQIIAQIADGGGWKTSVTLVNTDVTNAQTFTLRFWPSAKTPTNLPLVLEGSDQLSNLALTRTIPAGGSITLQTRGLDSAPLWQGWAELTSSGAIGGTAIFRKQVNAAQDAEGAVPLKPVSVGRFLLPFDNTQPFTTSVALVNPSPTQTTTIKAIFRDEYGTLITEPTTFTLGPRGHEAYALRDQFRNTVNKRGVAEFSASCGELAGLGLRFHEVLSAFTSFETVDPDSGVGATAISHIAAGSGWETSIILVNTDSLSPAKYNLRFWPGKDTPPDQAPAVEGRPRRDLTLSGTIPVGGSVNLEVRGSGGGSIWQGWAEINVTSGGIGGLGVFRKQVSGTDYAEGSVPLAALRSSRFLLPFDNLRSFLTTMALVNPNAPQGNTVRASFRNESGQPIGTAGSIALQARGHDAFALIDRFRGVESLRGVADFTTTGAAILGLGLRFNPRFAFTSLPILRK